MLRRDQVESIEHEGAGDQRGAGLLGDDDRVRNPRRVEPVAGAQELAVLVRPVEIGAAVFIEGGAVAIELDMVGALNSPRLARGARGRLGVEQRRALRRIGHGPLPQHGLLLGGK